MDEEHKQPTQADFNAVVAEVLVDTVGTLAHLATATASLAMKLGSGSVGAAGLSPMDEKEIFTYMNDTQLSLHKAVAKLRKVSDIANSLANQSTDAKGAADGER